MLGLLAFPARPQGCLGCCCLLLAFFPASRVDHFCWLVFRPVGSASGTSSLPRSPCCAVLPFWILYVSVLQSLIFLRNFHFFGNCLYFHLFQGYFPFSQHSYHRSCEAVLSWCLSGHRIVQFGCLTVLLITPQKAWRAGVVRRVFTSVSSWPLQLMIFFSQEGWGFPDSSYAECSGPYNLLILNRCSEIPSLMWVLWVTLIFMLARPLSWLDAAPESWPCFCGCALSVCALQPTRPPQGCPPGP